MVTNKIKGRTYLPPGVMINIIDPYTGASEDEIDKNGKYV